MVSFKYVQLVLVGFLLYSETKFWCWDPPRVSQLVKTVTLKTYHPKIIGSIPLGSTEVSGLPCLRITSVLIVFRISRGAQKLDWTPDNQIKRLKKNNWCWIA